MAKCLEEGRPTAGIAAVTFDDGYANNLIAAELLDPRRSYLAVVGPYRVRFHLHEPFPDFMAYYGTLATGAGWVVPKQYVEKVGDDGFKKAPIGAGPYRFVSFNPGIELVVKSPGVPGDAAPVAAARSEA